MNKDNTFQEYNGDHGSGNNLEIHNYSIHNYKEETFLRFNSINYHRDMDGSCMFQCLRLNNQHNHFLLLINN